MHTLSEASFELSALLQSLREQDERRRQVDPGYGHFLQLPI